MSTPIVTGDAAPKPCDFRELAKAQTMEFTPALMDEVASGRRIRRSPYDKLPLHASPSQIKKIKRETATARPRWSTPSRSSVASRRPYTRFGDNAYGGL